MTPRFSNPVQLNKRACPGSYATVPTVDGKAQCPSCSGLFEPKANGTIRGHHRRTW